ncbi:MULTISPECIES: hypothetical protein [unclassified Sporosarcina]|uniref:hypothetical protein n=1 Tax=unclassified Sporosarcina TaxID=2647733 RepID=UPI00203B3352|nr:MULTISPECIES: hypothetical protein [unclassified Sporosarcina]GKV64697.1 hypothetical protein NCCP2331_08500 [Sporosarcina sp. NCCP-2331]GLB54807.1 hypothetical protein NCCP2378_05920 [Sporosarcina sp. NCCP-2378]
MYDPTVFENLKVAFENHIYDLDNLERLIYIHNRSDQLDLAVMSRKFTIRFSLKGCHAVTCELALHASTQELANEILEVGDTEPGCLLTLRVRHQVRDVETECREIEQILGKVWEDDIFFLQTLSFHFDQKKRVYLNTIDIDFKPKLTEEHMGEINEFLKNVLEMIRLIGDNCK